MTCPDMSLEAWRKLRDMRISDRIARVYSTQQFVWYQKTVKETIGVGVNEKAALSSDKNCPFVYLNFDFTLVNKVASL